MSSGLVPDPAAMRRLRLALEQVAGRAGSAGVIELMIAICRLSTFSSRLRSAS